MMNVRAHMGDIELTCEGTPSEFIADLCCIIKAINDGLPETIRGIFYESLLQTLEEACIEGIYEGS